MPSLQQAFWEMDVYGFTLLKGVLNAEEVMSLRVSLAEWAERLGTVQKFRGQAGHVSNLPALDTLYHPLIDHPRTLPVIEHVLGEEIILGSLNARIVRPGDPEQGLHSDIRGDLLNMGSPVMVNTVWLLDDFTPENGATRIVPGSHKSGMAGPPEGMDVKHVFQLVAPAGSVLVFNGQCWHGGGANQTQTDRHALFGHYRKNALIFQVDPHDGFEEGWLEKLNPRQRALLRMENGLAAPHAADSHLRFSFSRGKKKMD